MSTPVLCAAPEVDLFCVWSTSADRVVTAGSRAEVEQWWREEYGRSGRPEKVVELAARTGSSVRSRVGSGPLFGSWEHDGLTVRSGPAGWLPRARLGEYLRAWLAHDDAAAAALLEPITEDDQDDDQGAQRPPFSAFGGHVHIVMPSYLRGSEG